MDFSLSFLAAMLDAEGTTGCVSETGGVIVNIPCKEITRNSYMAMHDLNVNGTLDRYFAHVPFERGKTSAKY